MKLIKKLQECGTIGQADPILTKLNAGPAVKKLVETAIILSNSPDQQQRNHAYSFMESAIKELEDNDDDDDDIKEEKMGMHGNEDGLNNPTIGAEGDTTVSEEEDDKKDNKIHEEELSNHNQGGRTDGSDQSTDNTEPYPGEGEPTQDGEKPMEDMANTVNQWNETGGMPPGQPGGMPPGQPGGMPPGQPGMMPPNQMAGAPPPNGGGMIVPGLAPDIAQEMGMGMPAPPPMDTSQMMRQMQYTLNDYHKKVVNPLNQRLNATTKHYKEALTQYKAQSTKILNQQKEAIKELSSELRETKATNGSMKLDLDTLRNNASAKFRETVPSDAPTFNGMPMSGIQPVPTIMHDKIENARSQITEMDKILRTKSSEIYS